MNLYRILIVDDEPANLKLIYRLILESKEPYILYQALNGELALKIANTEIPDIIITDWEMKGMDGLELIRNLKQNKATSDIPVIMCTGVMITPENLYTALTAGAVDYIRKPIEKIELLARIKSMLMLSDSRKVIKEKYELIKQNVIFIHSIIESIPHPFFFYNLNGEIKGCNHKFEILSGQSNSNLIGTNLDIYKEYYQNNVHKTHDDLLKSNLQDITYEGDLNGKYFIFSKTLYFNSNSDPEGIMCVLTDVTELKQAHHEVLESKKRELTSIALQLAHTGELNNNLILDLGNLHSYTNSDGSELIRQTINKFSTKSIDGFWREFESHFENVYESFYNNLNNMFPDLTPREKKLCALLRLNLSSKDIAAIIFQNPQSIDMARYRLRKKLNLSQDENLIDFLMNIN